MHTLLLLIDLVGKCILFDWICRVSSWSAQGEDSEAKDTIVGASKSKSGTVW